MGDSGGPSTRPRPGDLGERLREHRQEQGLSVRQLARAIGVSPSLISQIELGKAQPSVSTLYAMTTRLGASVDGLFAAGDRASPPEPAPLQPAATQPSPVQPAATRQSLVLEGGVRWERLTPDSRPGVDFLRVIYEVGGASSPAGTFHRHEGLEWGYVECGRLGVTIGFERYELGPGDAISFDSTVPHRLENLGGEPVEGIWFVLGRRSTASVELDGDPLLERSSPS